MIINTFVKVWYVYVLPSHKNKKNYVITTLFFFKKDFKKIENENF